ncbi:MAG: hypothetical protein QM758_21220 [Armatimonas sp.]
MSAASTAHTVVTIDTEPPAPKGRFLAQWGVRLIEEQNLAIIEFLDNPWYTEPARRRARRMNALHRALQALRLV